MFPNFFHNSINQFVLYGYYYAFLYGHVINVNKPRASQKSKILAHHCVACKVFRGIQNYKGFWPKIILILYPSLKNYIIIRY